MATDDSGVEGYRVELTERQRERLDDIKAECKEADPGLPEPTDEQMIDSLLDTWDAAGNGLYVVPQEERC